MDTFSTNGKPLAQQGKEAINKAADSKADDMRSSADPMVDRAGDQTQKLMQQGREVLHDTTQTVRDKATQASDMAVSYTKDEPVKAMLIAAASGALLMGLVSVMARSRN
jgi:ElaB/YqjD/DUF883 family membrane-anchored ribosome-binding protein